MPFWSGETLTKRLPGLISGFNPDQIDCSAYQLRVGHQAYITPNHEVQNPSSHTVINLEGTNKAITIPPGQFGFLLTEEVVKVPEDAIAFISMKASYKFQGLINVSGFHVDSGFHGRLLFSFFNAGPKTIHMSRNDEVFLIWYASLDTDTTMARDKGEENKNISNNVLNGISGQIQSHHKLSDKLDALEESFRSLKIASAIVGTLFALLVAPILVESYKGWFSTNDQSPHAPQDQAAIPPTPLANPKNTAPTKQ